MANASNTERFSDRVENYVRYRPTYPEAVLRHLREHAGLNANAFVADIGSGTGIFSRLLLPECARVYAVEPNAAMRGAAENASRDNPKFVSVARPAESTGLPDRSVDLITAAQAFHWFDIAACQREFTRILKPGGKIAIIWNERLVNASPLLRDYEELLKRHATDYEKVNHATNDVSKVRAFFGDRPFSTVEFPNEQRFDEAGFRGRFLSSSYAPNVGHPGYEAADQALRECFRRHQREGSIAFLYTTKVYVGSAPLDA
ncbi:MAG TPA: class I SAM-dependent methyltransferase [Opitutaceae bacterium]|nr:class I SAM-dependent methyltransferase [Opitutaceae bacterium]